MSSQEAPDGSTLKYQTRLRHDARIDIDAHQQHAAIDTGAQHIGLMVIGCAKPAPCLRDHSGSLFLFRHLF